MACRRCTADTFSALSFRLLGSTRREWRRNPCVPTSCDALWPYFPYCENNAGRRAATRLRKPATVHGRCRSMRSSIGHECLCPQALQRTPMIAILRCPIARLAPLPAFMGLLSMAPHTVGRGVRLFYHNPGNKPGTNLATTIPTTANTKARRARLVNPNIGLPPNFCLARAVIWLFAWRKIMHSEHGTLRVKLRLL
jgi:hypothetical protein